MSGKNLMLHVFTFQINTTFAKIEEFQQEVQQLASGASSLENITSGDTDMEVISLCTVRFYHEQIHVF